MARAVTAAKRMMEALEAVGKSIAAVDCLPDGGYRILLGEPMAPVSLSPKGGANEWDEVLPRQ